MGMRKKICGCLLTACLLAVSLGRLTDLMERKASDFKYEPFFAQDENFDVLFLGTSHVINGIFPMELWKDYGMVSYNFGGHGNTLPVSYWVLRNALDYTTPRLVVIDGYFLSAQIKSNGTFSQMHLSLDAFPLSLTKLSAVQDLFEDEAMEENIAAGTVADAAERTKLSLLWDFSVYHSRWNELSADDFAPGRSKEKGAESRIDVSVPNEIPSVPADERMEGETAGTQYLGRMIQYCRKRGIDVLLTYLPFPSTQEQQKEANRLDKTAGDYGVNYINFLDMGLVDYETDCFDSYSHLNPSGARKVTDYLGQYIAAHYDIPDQRNQAAYRGWHDDYAAYEEFKAANLKQQQELDVYLMLLADKNYDILIEVENHDAFSSGSYASLLENIGIDTGKITESTDCIFVREAGRQVDYFENFRLSGQACQTAAGAFRAEDHADGTYSVYLDDRQLYAAGTQPEEAADLRIAVFDKDDKRQLDSAAFLAGSRKDAGNDAQW